jgi:hypothetical protein
MTEYRAASWKRKSTRNVVAIVLFIIGAVVMLPRQRPAEEPVFLADGTQRIPVVFSGGFETNPADRGRPVNLIAGALGVAPEVFRGAFSRVRPAPAGTEPAGERVRENKQVLLAALGPHGITNERLDTVTDYYRYNRSRGEMWPTEPATAFAFVQNGAMAPFEITNGGSGYNSPPTVTVPGVDGAAAEVQLSFGAEFDGNGSVTAIALRAGE